MALMRYRSKPRPRSIYAHLNDDDRQPEHLGDVPPAPATPPDITWSLTSYPAAEPPREEGSDDG